MQNGANPLNRQRTLRVLTAVSVLLMSAVCMPALACTLVKLEEWPVRWINGHPVVDGTINNRPIGVMLDTGSTRSLIPSSAARRLDLQRRQARNYRMFGVGGESVVETAYVESFGIGQMVRKGMYLIVAGAQETSSGIDVILGEDFLQKADVEFDLAHGVVRLFDAQDCGGASLAYWTKETVGEVAIEPFQETQPQIIVRVAINGVPMRALLDSGAPASILTKPDAAAAGLTPDSPGVIAAGSARGIGAKSIDTWIGPIDTFTIGNENIRSTTILFGDLFRDAAAADTGSRIPRQLAGPQQMLLGVDFLRTHRVLIAHSQRKLYFSHVGGPVFRPRAAPVSPPAPDAEGGKASAPGGG
jgi:predicted aspartyl protease